MRRLTLGLLLVLGCTGGGRYGVPPERVETLDVRGGYSNHGYFHDVRVKVEHVRGVNPLERCLRREITVKARGYMVPREIPSHVRAVDYQCDERWDRFRFRDRREEEQFKAPGLNRKLRDDLDFIYYAVLTSYIWSDKPSEGVR